MPRLRNHFRNGFVLATIVTLISVTSSMAADRATSATSATSDEAAPRVVDPAKADPRSDADCPPLATNSDPQPAIVLEPGIGPGGSRAAGSSTRGEIVPLPAAAEPRSVDAIEGEALVLIPRSSDALVGLRLAPDARIVESFWSPVLCSTMVRVVGPVHLSPRELIAAAPAGAHISPNLRYMTAATEVRPLIAPRPAPVGPDPYISLQHGLKETGVLDGRPTFAGGSVRVAVLDSAPDITHPELERVRVQALREGPPPTPALHGTLVTGVIAAMEGNAFGIAGVAPEADVVAVPVCAPAPGLAVDVCRMNDVLRGIDAAWQSEARVVSLALVGPPDPLLQRAIERLEQLEILVVAAAGNEGGDAPRYPAAYPSVIGVGATDTKHRRWPRSNHGPWVSLYAPGTEVLSTVPGDQFAFGDGTSLAAAHVTGLLAVMVAAVDHPLDAREALLAAANGTRASVSDGQTRRTAARTPPELVTMPTLCDTLPLLGTSCSARLPTPAAKP